MSVAFRRESDEEHLEPKFEIPIPSGPNLVTQRGLEQIKTRVAELEALLPTLVEETDRNPVSRDLRYWRTRLATAEVMPVAKGEKVEFGCRVTFLLNEKERSIQIVGHDEADPTRNLLSFLAPLSRAMMGAEPNDHVDFNGVDGAIAIIAVGPA